MTNVVFDPTKPDASNSSGTPWLVGKNGQAVNLSCAFVPYGQYSCDTGGNLKGWDPKYVSYSNFLDGTAPIPYAPFKPYAALPQTNFNGAGYHLDLNYSFNDNLQLVYIGSYRSYNSKFGQDQDASPVPSSQLDNELNHHAFTSEVRLNYKTAGGFLESTVGVFYLDQKGIYTARVDLNYVDPVIDFLHGPDATPSETKAVFGTATIHPTEKLSFTGGIRYTEDAKDYTYFRSNPDGTVPNPANCVPGPDWYTHPNCLLAGIYDITGSFKGEHTDWRVVGDYRFTDDFLAYASVSTGIKGGGVNPRPFFITQRLPFEPETLTAYEMGFKSDLFGNRMRLNGAVFLNKYDDIQLSKQVCPESFPFPSQPCLRPDNIGAADVQGAELEASIYPARGLSFDASISYLDFKYTSEVDPATGFLVNTGIDAGNITPYTPELSYSVGGQYDHRTDAGTFSIRLDGAYQDELFTNAENTEYGRIPGRMIANARLSWADMADKWKVALDIQNLADKYYFMSKSDVSQSQVGVVTGVPGLPRTWQLSVERKF